MPTYISLLRGINVSGQKKVPMAELREVYEALGFAPVQTYIQSGNVIFRSEETKVAVLRDRLEEAIRQFFGFDVVVILKTAEALRQVVEHPLFSSRSEAINYLYITFLAERPDPARVAALSPPASGGDEFQVVNREVYVFCPNGYGRTKLNTTFFERALKVHATTRNGNTTRKLLEIATGLS